MAKVNSIINISGSIGNHTFVQTKNGCYVREKISISKKRFATDPRFKSLRQNCAEFGRAGKAGKLLRDAIKPLLNCAADSKSSVRLISELMKIIKADDIHTRGQRQILPSKIEKLQGFEFNQNARLNNIFHTVYSEHINRHTDRFEIIFPSFRPLDYFTAPVCATHFKLIAAAAAIDFKNEKYNSDTTESDLLPLNYEPSENINLVNSMSNENNLPLFLVFGIQFFQVVNGYPESLKNSNTLRLIKVIGSEKLA